MLEQGQVGCMGQGAEAGKSPFLFHKSEEAREYFPHIDSAALQSFDVLPLDSHDLQE